MTLLTPEQFAAAQKANLETLFGLTSKAFEGVEKLVELNIQVVKSTIAESQENAQRALSVKDAQELLALQASLTQPVAEKVLSYGRHLYEIASATQAEFARVAEAQYEEQNKKVQALVENVAKNAPAGSETAVAGGLGRKVFPPEHPLDEVLGGIVHVVPGLQPERQVSEDGRAIDLEETLQSTLRRRLSLTQREQERGPMRARQDPQTPSLAQPARRARFHLL